jgi:hypothetical protein
MTPDEMASAIKELARQVDEGSTQQTVRVQRTTNITAPTTSVGVTWLNAAIVVTTSTTPTGGIISFTASGIPQSAKTAWVQVVIQHNAAVAASTIFSVRNGLSGITFNAVLLGHSAIAGDALTTVVPVPIEGGILYYEMSGAPNGFEVNIVGYN